MKVGKPVVVGREVNTKMNKETKIGLITAIDTLGYLPPIGVSCPVPVMVSECTWKTHSHRAGARADVLPSVLFGGWFVKKTRNAESEQVRVTFFSLRIRSME